MAGGLHKFTVVEAGNIGLGQSGNAFTDTTDQYTPPSGTVIVAITMAATSSFSELTPENTNSWAGTTAASPGTNGSTMDSSDTFPSGVTIYGRWLSCTLQSASDAILIYFAP